MAHEIAAFAGSPRRDGNSESLLDAALDGIREADSGALIHKVVLNELVIKPCQNCGFCSRTGYCRFASSDDMKGIYELLERCDRFIVASPIYFATVSAQTKIMFDRCQALWARKYLLKQRHANPDRRGLFLCCGGFKHDRFYKCAREVMSAWCVVLDIRMTGELFFSSIDEKGAIQAHPTALAEARAAGAALMNE